MVRVSDAVFVPQIGVKDGQGVASGRAGVMAAGTSLRGRCVVARATRRAARGVAGEHHDDQRRGGFPPGIRCGR